MARNLTPDPRSRESPDQPEPGRARLKDHRRRPGQRSHPADDVVVSGGVNRFRNTSPVWPSIAAATTDRTSTSRPTLLRR